MRPSFKSLMLLSGLVGGVLAAPVSSDEASVQFTTMAVEGAVEAAEEPALDANTILGVLDQAFPQIDELAVMSTLKQIDLKAVIQDLMPLLLQGMKDLQTLSGDTIVTFVENLTGDEIINWVRSLDFDTLSALIDDLEVVPLVKALVGVDITTAVEALRTLDGAQVVDWFASLTGQDLANIANSLGVDELATRLGVSGTKVLDYIAQTSGQEILDKIATFNGQEIITEIESWNGEDVANIVNGAVNKVLTKVRNGWAAAKGLPTPAAYTDFDVVKTIEVLEQFFNEITGLSLPDITEFITHIDGARSVEAFRQLSIRDFIQSVVPIGEMAALHGYVAKQLLPVVKGEESVQDYKTLLLQQLNGADFIASLEQLDLDPLLDVLEKFASTPLYLVFTDVDLMPYIDGLRQFNGEVLVQNIEDLTGARLLQLLDDLGVFAFLDGIEGIDYSRLTSLIQNFSGQNLMDAIRQFDGATYVAQAQQAASATAVPVSA